MKATPLFNILRGQGNRKAIHYRTGSIQEIQTNKPELAQLLETKQVIPAAELVRVCEEEARVAKEFEGTAQSEASHRKLKNRHG